MTTEPHPSKSDHADFATFPRVEGKFYCSLLAFPTGKVSIEELFLAFPTGEGGTAQP